MSDLRSRTTKGSTRPLLPIEVLRVILKHACSVSEAFYYPLKEAELHEMFVTQLIQESMATKLSVSRVSKLFHTLADEFLYEIIQLRSFRFIRRLVKRLRSPSDTKGIAKGWWCRRLEVDLSLVSREWHWGCISLWGLVTACPRLTDLRCFLVHTLIPNHIVGNQLTLPVSLPLAQIIARRFGPSLRHLQLGKDVTIDAYLLMHLLVHLPVLEVCRVSRLQPLSGTEISQTFNLDITADETRVPRLPESCRNATESAEYMDAARTASWPDVTPRSVELPHLQDLRIRPYLEIINGWKLPALRSITDSFLPVREVEWHTYDHDSALHRGLQGHRQSLEHFTYNVFRGRTLPDVIAHMPSLQHLRVVLWFDSASEVGGPLFREPHDSLRTITLFRRLESAILVGFWIDKILTDVEAGKLPNLSIIKVRGTGVSWLLVEEQRLRCQALKLILEVRDIEWNTWCE